MGTAALLIVAGSLAQGAGVGLVAWEYRDTRQRMREYRNRSKTVYASAASIMATVGTAAAGVVNSPLGPPDLLDRVQRLEQRIRDHDTAIATVRDEVADRVRKAEERVKREIAQSIESTRLTVMDDVTALAELVGDLNDEGWGHRRRVASVVLLILGLAATMIGSVIGL